MLQLWLTFMLQNGLLTYKDYIGGPEADREPDKYPDRQWWMFVTDLEGPWIYIKIRVDEKRGAICLSFHEPEYPYFHPYR